MPAPQPARRFSVASLLSLPVLTLAIVVIAGWLLHKPEWVALDGGTAMVLNTALCFTFVAFAVLSESLPEAVQRRVQSLFGTGVALLAALVLGEHILDRSLGIDWEALHLWQRDDNAHPGRMAWATATAFLLCGGVLILMHQVRGLWSGLLVQALTVAIVVIGSVGIVGNLLKLPLVFDSYPFGQMAFTTAVSFILVGIALWQHWARAIWYRGRSLIAHEAQQISLNSLAVLAGIVLISMLTGLVLARQQIEALAGSSLLWPLKSRVDTFRINIELHSNQATATATRADVLQSLERLKDNVDDAEALSRLRETAESFLPFGFSSIVFLAPDGRALVKAGRVFEQPALAVDIHASPQSSRLMWAGEHFVLQTRTVVQNTNVTAGTMVAEQRLTALTAALEYAEDFAASGEIAVCARQSENLACFPQRHIANVYTVPYSAALPMARALAGETGVRITRDQRQRNVMAAYQPIGTLGLGMVVKMDTRELFAPLREQLYLVLAVAVLLVAEGAGLLYWRVSPLTRKLALGEQRLMLALEGSRTAWWDWHIPSGTLLLSDYWQVMLGNPGKETSTTLAGLEALVHPDDLPVLRRRLRDAIKSGAVPYDVEHRVKRPDGTWLWVHSMGRVMERDRNDRAIRMIGINSDITQRKEAAIRLGYQSQHDALTGLPNALTFSDRLQHAIAHARFRNAPIAVIYLGIDGFKQFNDNFGQPAGNALLKSFARRLETCVRTVDTIARLNADKYAIVLEVLASRDEGERIALRIQETVRTAFTLDQRSVNVTASVGIAYYLGGADAPAADALLRAAENAYSEAVSSGRNTFKVARDQPTVDPVGELLDPL